MTNYEKIKSMSVEEMAAKLVELDICYLCAYKSNYCKSDCGFVKGIKKWLESEVNND